MTGLLSFCAGVLTLLLVIIARGRALERRWWAQRAAALAKENEKFLNAGARRRLRKQRAGK
jgi:hypothetical protein